MPLERKCEGTSITPQMSTKEFETVAQRYPWRAQVFVNVCFCYSSVLIFNRNFIPWHEFKSGNCSDKAPIALPTGELFPCNLHCRRKLKSDTLNTWELVCPGHLAVFQVRARYSQLGSFDVIFQSQPSQDNSEIQRQGASTPMSSDGGPLHRGIFRTCQALGQRSVRRHRHQHDPSQQTTMVVVSSMTSSPEAAHSYAVAQFGVPP